MNDTKDISENLEKRGSIYPTGLAGLSAGIKKIDRDAWASIETNKPMPSIQEGLTNLQEILRTQKEKCVIQ